MDTIPTRPRRVSLADLDETRRTFPQEVKADPARELFTAAATVVCHFFGRDWYMEHVSQDAEGSQPPGYMRIDYMPGPEGEKKNRVCSVSRRTSSISNKSTASVTA